MPTTIINGENIPFDPVQSSKNNIVTMKEMLASYGYNWVYDSEEDYENRNLTNKKIIENYKKREQTSDVESGASNLSHLQPPRG